MILALDLPDDVYRLLRLRCFEMAMSPSEYVSALVSHDHGLADYSLPALGAPVCRPCPSCGGCGRYQDETGHHDCIMCHATGWVGPLD